jgi:hypothetical protein
LRIAHGNISSASMKKLGPPKLPDFNASAMPGGPGLKVQGTPGAMAGPIWSWRTPRPAITAPEVSPPATIGRRTPESISRTAMRSKARSTSAPARSRPSWAWTVASWSGRADQDRPIVRLSDGPLGHRFDRRVIDSQRERIEPPRRPALPYSSDLGMRRHRVRTRQDYSPPFWPEGRIDPNMLGQQTPRTKVLHEARGNRGTPGQQGQVEAGDGDIMEMSVFDRIDHHEGDA